MDEIQRIIYRETISHGRLFGVYPKAGEHPVDFNLRVNDADDARGGIPYTVDELEAMARDKGLGTGQP